MKLSKETSKVLGLILIVLFALGLVDFVYNGDFQTFEEEVLVSRVIDGDTIELNDSRRVRYVGIDTPEVDGDCFANKATLRNTELVEGEFVKLKVEDEEIDDYGRLLRRVFVNGEDIGLILVEEGYARVDEWFVKGSYEIELLKAQEGAMIENRGLWGVCS